MRGRIGAREGRCGEKIYRGMQRIGCVMFNRIDRNLGELHILRASPRCESDKQVAGCGEAARQERGPGSNAAMSSRPTGHYWALA